jgi:undecaprenyl-diphosphatase
MTRRRVVLTTLIALTLALSAYAATDALVWGEHAFARVVQDTPGGRLFEPVADLLAVKQVDFALLTVAAGLALMRRNYALAAAALFVISANMLNQPLKELIDRARPGVEQLDVREPARSTGYPSGHTMSAFLLYGYFMLVMWRCTPRPFALCCALASSVAIALIGWDRVYDGAHWPSDVAGGAAIAVLLLSLAVALPGSLFAFAEGRAQVGHSTRRGLGWLGGDRFSP